MITLPTLRYIAAPVDGGDDDDDEDEAPAGDGVVVDLDEDGNDNDGDEDDERSPEQLRDALKTMKASLDKSSGSNKAKRERIRKLEAELTAARQGKPVAEGDKVDIEAVKAEAKREAREESDLRTKKAELRGALLAAGVSPERVKRFASQPDYLEALDVDDDGEIDGLEDLVATVKDEWPEAFPSKRRRRESVAGGGDRDGRGAPKRELSASEQQAAQLRG